MTETNQQDAAGLSKEQRVARNYRRARRKLLSCRRAGVQAVAEYLVHSYLARRLVGLEQRRPASIAPMEATTAEVAAYRAALRAQELKHAISLGGEAQARAIRLEQGLAKLETEPAKQLLRDLFELGGHQTVFFGFSDDHCRRLVLLPGGAELPDDGEPPVAVADLVARAFKHVFACVTTIRTEATQTVHVYEARAAEFHAELRKDVYAAVVAGGQVAYMDANQVKAGLDTDQRTMTPLPRVPGAVYCSWPSAEPVPGENHE